MPVINPWWIYLVNVISKVNYVVLGALIMSGIFILSCGSIFFDESPPTGESKSLFSRILKIFPVLLVLHILMPSRDTLFGMMVAKHVTVERVDIEKEVVAKVYKDILNVIKGDKDED
ncbi:MAG: hypothetical protein ACRC0F_00590 [Cetobacterium sp.]